MTDDLDESSESPTFECVAVCRATGRHPYADAGTALPVFDTDTNSVEIPIPAVAPVARIDLPRPMTPGELETWLASDAAIDALKQHLDDETAHSVRKIAIDDLR